MSEQTKKGTTAILAAAMLWGTTGSAQMLAPTGSDPISIGAIRMFFGGLVMVLIPLIKQGFQIGVLPHKKLLILAAGCMAAYQPFFFTGVVESGVAIGTLLAIGSAPIFSGAIDLLHGKRLHFQWKISTAISIVGCILLTGIADSVQVNAIGMACALMAGFSYAVYVDATQRMVQSGFNALTNGMIFLLAGLILLPLLGLRDLSWMWSLRGSAVILHLGVVATAIAYTLFAHGLRTVESATAVTLSLAEPFTAAIMGMLVLQEQLVVSQIIGLVLLFAGLSLNSKKLFWILFPKRKWV